MEPDKIQEGRDKGGSLGKTWNHLPSKKPAQNCAQNFAGRLTLRLRVLGSGAGIGFGIRPRGGTTPGLGSRIL